MRYDKMISIVCVFNDSKVLDKYLLKSLKPQTATYELILIDNTNKQFFSAPEALNNGGIKTKGDYIMFVHQDVDLCSDKWLENIEKSLNSLYNLGAAGVAGKSKDGLVSNIKHGTPPMLAGTIHIKRPTKVQTLDECLFIIPKPVFNNYKFDEETCNDWHLYAVEYCLRIKKKDFNIFVLPDYIYHASAGYSISKSYFFILENLLKNYKNDYNLIYTTVWNWNSSYSFFLQKVWYLIRLRISNFRRYLIKRWGIWEYH